MLNSRSCDDVAQNALQKAFVGNPLEKLARNLPLEQGQERSPEELKKAAEDFAAIFYGLLIKEMQQTVPKDEDESPFAEGVRDFMHLYMPKVLAASEADPLGEYIENQFSDQAGDTVDEQI